MATYILGQNNEKCNYVPLSKAHIRPFLVPVVKNELPNVKYYKGASLFRSTKSRKCQAVGGGARGGIKGFSRNSRRRLLELIACVKRSAELPQFVTLTYPEKFPTVERAKRDLKIFFQRLNRRFPEVGYIWKLEPQKRGAPHFHILVWGIDTIDLFSWTVKNWFNIAGDGDKNHFLFHAGVLPGSKPCVSKVRSFRGVWSYAAKYLGKTFEVADWGSKWTGRFWGVGNRQNIPLGELQTIETDYSTVVQLMRYQRKFMNMRKAKDLNSLKTFCDCDQWVNRFLPNVKRE